MPYKLVMGKLLPRTTPPGLNSEEKVKTVIRNLFPDHQQRLAPRRPIDHTEPADILIDELNKAERALKKKIAPGLDGVTNEAIKMVAERQPNTLLTLFNQCIAERRFPDVWKEARLILLKKGDKSDDDPSSYRPICLLDCLGKLLEKILDNRIRQFLEEPGEEAEGLNDNQYGFRTSRTTTDAIDAVCKMTEEGGLKMKVGVILIDIKNAFNSAPWGKILEAAELKNIPQYLIRIIDSYLSNRSILYKDDGGINISETVTCGVPQESVLGPTLWNILMTVY